MAADNVIVSVSKSDIFSVTMAFNSSSDFSDDLILINRVRVQCKVISMFDKEVVINFPRDSIRSVEMDFTKQNQPGQSNYIEKTTTVGYGDKNRRSTQSSRNRFEEGSKKKDDVFFDFVTLEEDSDKDDFEEKSDKYKANSDVKNRMLSEIKTSKDNVKKQLLSDIKGLKSNNAPSTAGGIDLLDKTLNNQAQASPINNKREEEFDRKSRPVSRTVQDINLGKVKGRFIINGDPLEACKVRLVNLKKEGPTFYKDTRNSKPLETVTDRYGIYSLSNVKPGFYKLYWKPRSESSWIRKVSMEPDVVVEPGKIGYLDDIETNQRILN